MGEGFKMTPAPEEPENVVVPEGLSEKEKVLSDFKLLRERIITVLGKVSSQSEGQTSDEQAVNVEDLLRELRDQAGVIASWGNDDLRHRINLQETMVKVDGGLTDPEELDEILSFLRQDSPNAEKLDNNPVRDKTRQQIKIAMERVQAVLSKTQVPQADYDLSDIDPNSKVETGPEVDLLQELRDANEKAVSEDPDYKKSKDGGNALVWKYLSDEAKRMWNYQIWNPKFLTNPSTVEHYMTEIPERKLKSIPLGKKVKIDRPR